MHLARRFDRKNTVFGISRNLIEKLVLTLFSMGYFKNTTVWGEAVMAPPCNFAVS